ncbi:hypothetical protein BDW22DRAFT_836849 [Trametopsis cervina]|nr:hypothetical protein BDW22DRAFT_836849 [Trametopsis cervina]
MVTDEPDEPMVVVKDYLSFPPFPTPPPGVTLIPFSQFKPLGIAVSIDPEESKENEVDGLGVPTIRLRVRHDLTPEERRMGKKKMTTATTLTADGHVRKMLWHEEWKQHEHLHRFAVDTRLSEFDRLGQASQEFKNSRAWPPSTSPLTNLWDQIRLYIGLITSIQPPPSKRKKNQQLAAEPDDDEDVDEVEDFREGKDVVVGKIDNYNPATDQPGAIENTAKPKPDDAQRELIKEQRIARKDERVQEFLYQTETTLKIMFSAHWRDRGLAWDKRKSEECPILMAFFMRFLIQNNVFPEPEISRGLQRGLTVCEQAQAELPATFVVARALEDGISKGLKDRFGSMANTFAFWDDIEEKADAEEQKADVKEQKADAKEQESEDEIEQPDPKKRKVEETTNDEDVIVIDSRDMPVEDAMLKDAITDNVDVNGVEVDPAATGWGGTWGMDDSGWGAGAAGAWGGDTANWGTEDAAAPGDNPSKATIDEWTIQKDTTLSDLLGDTADQLTNTHTTGIVERSTRRIAKVIKSSEGKAAPKAKGSGKDREAAKVEAELESKLAYMVLAPWVKVGNHTASDVLSPVLQEHSRGDVVPIPVKGETPVEPAPAGAFDPRKDEIRVLLDPATCDKLTVGMGLSATWVQLVRKDGEDEPSDVSGKGKNRESAKKGAPGKNGVPTQWWYMEQFMSTLVSFHTDRYFPGQD